MKKFNIQSEKFLELLEPLASVINDNHIIPIFQNVKIEIHKGKIYATGDNSEINCVNIADIKSDLKIGFCTNYTILLSLLKSIKNQNAEFRIDDANMVIIHSKGDFNVPLFKFSEYPAAPKEKFKSSAKVKGKDLKSALRVANKFILNSEMEPFANILIEIGKKVTIRSSNKISLFKERIKGKGDAQNVLLGGRSSTALLSLIGDKKIEMLYSAEKIFFKTEEREVMVIQQQGEFPVKSFDDILKTVGDEDSDELKLDFPSFITSLKRSSILSNHENSLKLTLSKKELEITSDNKDTSSKSQELLPVKFPKERIVGYNSKLLVEILQVFDKETELFINKANCFCFKSGNKIGLLAPVILNKK